MKRSTINRDILWGINLLKENNISLPEFALWSPEEWERNKDKLSTVINVSLGWEVKDFSEEMGATLFTIRNGKYNDLSIGVPYCEKLIMFKDGKRLPLHYHKEKTEDVINRAAGIMQIKLYHTTASGELDLASDVDVFQDGILHTHKAGEYFYINPGSSITLTPGIAHTFGPKPGGPLIVGEVSVVNNDLTDNFRFEKVPDQYPVEEDEEIMFPICTEYKTFLHII